MDDREKILVIDDELAPRESIRMVLKDTYNVSTATGAPEGLELMAENDMDLVVMDIRMPRMDGITALREIKTRHPDTEVILLTAFASLDTAREAIRHGAFDYLIKPFDKDDVLAVVKKGMEKRRRRTNLKVERDTLLDKATDLEKQIHEARTNIVTCYEGTVKALILTIDAKDHYTYNHSNRVAVLSAALARHMGVSGSTIKEIVHAASIHDIGKVGIDEQMLRKDGKLTSEEYEEIKRHPEIGVRIVQSVPFLEDAIPVIRSHHERYDGMGYPTGIQGEEIPLSARIVMVADAVDAMLNSRPYRGALTEEKVLDELRDNSGTQFDPAVVDIILQEKVSLKYSELEH